MTTTADLASDVIYIETLTKALSNRSASLVEDVLDLKSRIEALPAIVTDVRIGPGEYHACPTTPAPMQKLAAVLAAGALVLVEDSKKVIYRMVGYTAEKDSIIITPVRNEMGRQAISNAARWVCGYIIYSKFNA